jgi:Subtilase family
MATEKPDFGLWDRDPGLPDPDALRRLGGRLLDPATATPVPGQPPPEVTAYLPAQLLVRADREGQALELLAGVASEAGWRVTVNRRLQVNRARRRDDEGLAGVSVFEIVPVGVETDNGLTPPAPPDAWELLARARTRFGVEAVQGVGLNHVLTAGGGLSATRTHHESNPTHHESNPDRSTEYPDSGGRLPVGYVGAPPARTPDADWKGGRRPVVGVLDTGCGEHEWLEPYVTRYLGVTDPVTGNRHRIGYGPGGAVPNAEVGGDFAGPLDGKLDDYSGHGTFICGLVRQTCPDADLLVWRVVPSQGLIPEFDWLNALTGIAELARQYAAGENDQPLDVLNLSAGYYHETPEDAAAYDPGVIDALTILADAGVAVVCSAGNDGTTRPSFPAAFAAEPYLPQGTLAVPLTSVGALNPAGRSVAIFSNTGPWVLSYQLGVSVFSTMPPFQAGMEPLLRTQPKGLPPRESKDPDNFTRPLACGHDRRRSKQVRSCGGFGLWNGTSFAAPVQAGFIAHAMQETLRTKAGGSAVDRASQAVAETVRPGP